MGLLVLATEALAEGAQDPWIAADDELGRSGAAAALKLVASLNGPDIAKLRAYLESDPPVQRELRAAFAKALALRDARKFKEVLEMLRPLELKKGTLLEARIWDLRAYAHAVLREEDKGLRALRQWRAIAERLKWLAGRRQALLWEREILLRAQRFEEMSNVHALLAEVERQLGHEKEMHGHRLDQAACLVEVGRVREALAVLAEPLEVSTKRGWRRFEAAARDNLAHALWKRGDYAAALHEVDRAAALWSELDEPEDQANNAMLKAAIEQELGDFEAAQKTFEELQQRIEGNRAFDPYFHAAVQGNLGVVAWRRGLHNEAVRRLRAALKEFEERKGLEHYGKDRAGACKDLGEVLIDAGRPREALPYLDRALEGLGSDPLLRAETLALQASARLAAGDPKRAAVLVNEAFAVDGADQDRRTRNRLYEIQARILLAGGKPGQAVASLRKSMDLMEDAVSGLSDDQTSSARAQRARLFQVAVEAAFRAGRAEDILEFLERSRAAVLREALGNRRALWRAALPPALAEVLREAEEDVVVARLRLLRALKGTKREPVEEARRALGVADEALRRLANQAQREHNLLARAAPTGTATLAEIRAALRPGETLVYYAFRGDECSAFWITAKKERSLPLGPSSELRELCARALDAYRTEGRAVPAAELRAALCAPLELPKGVTRVMVCPDGPLSYLPWPAILEERYGSTVPSGSTLVLLRRRAGSPGKAILAFGAPDYSVERTLAKGEVSRGPRLVALPKASEEVRKITTREGDLRFLHAKATEAAVRARIGGDKRWSAVHFACHGLVDRRFPRRSALALTPDPENDGFLTIPEIVTLDVHADLVVLSACDSGSGAFVRGEGVVGLARAFLAAGAPRVVASLWRVDDAATKELMVRFHRLRRERGLSTARALLEAQREVAADERWAHPRYWAAWVVWGVPDVRRS